LLSVLGLTLVFLVINVSLSWQWIDQPFAGFLHINRVIIKNSLAGWNIAETRIEDSNLAEGNMIVAVEGQAVTSSGQLNLFIRQQTIGQPLNYLLRNQSGQAAEVTLPVVSFTSQNFVELVIIPAFVASLALLTGAVAIYYRSNLIQA
jgi:hypothetical protein